MKVKHLVVSLLGIVMLVSMAGASLAAEAAYPTRPIEIVCSATPGGGNDTTTRAMAEFVSRRWNHPVTVINKPGGATVPAVHYALKESKPDGYTVLSDSHICSSFMVAAMKNPPVKLEDRIFLGRINLLPVAFAVKTDAQWKTFKELSDWAKANAKELSWGTTGAHGTSAFAIGEWLIALGVNPADTRMVTGGGWNEASVRLLGGHILLASQTVAEFLPLARAGRIRVLAVVAPKRNPLLPDVPTAAEVGYPQLKGVDWWTGLSLPKGTPQHIVDKWVKVIEEMCKDPVFLEKSAKLDYGVAYMGPKELTKYVYEQADFAKQLAPKLAGAKK
ncbi:MAG TPA: tripartite tricarboxylate transporter substrate binding protein [Syntrophorhabdaceae bacterium]|nr:tripartite tricarboxylate transporter substrate binding protein [Syntrophorhabdaceae bacterium]HQM80740.1 tripartite tricarboxylate transporter substrate binding protein [Syntrophorhabdaceae bacterium]